MTRAVFSISSGETQTVNVGERLVTATVKNTGTFKNTGTNTAGGLELTTLELPLLSVASGSTVSISSGTTREEGTAEVAGFVESGGILELGKEETTTVDIDQGTAAFDIIVSLSATATDIDQGTAPLTVRILLSGIGSDIDQSSGILSRIRDLLGTATDIDQSTAQIIAGALLSATATDVDQSTAPVQVANFLAASATDIDQSTAAIDRVRELLASGADIDNGVATARIIIPLQSERAVDSIIEILETDKISSYRNQDPTVLNYWDRTQQERGPGADQPAEIYVWETAGKDIERFSLDDDSTHDTASVEALIYSLDAQEVVDYAEDARNNIEQFFDDNKEATEWQTIEVTSVNDFREQTQRRSTDQYVVSLEIELEKIQSV